VLKKRFNLCNGRFVAGAVILATCAMATDAEAIIRRHDVPDSDYLIDEATYPALTNLLEPGDCMGTLVHPQLVITATHCARDTDYLIKSTVDIRYPTDPQLTIEDGVTLLFENSGMLRTGNSIDSGQLVVDGHTQGVLFTSDKTSPAPGDFNGIVFGTYDSGSTIDGLTLEYGSRATLGAITSYSSAPTVANSWITDSEDWGIYCYSFNQIVLTNVQYDLNADGDLYMP
jgi:hypothetical protein